MESGGRTQTLIHHSLSRPHLPTVCISAPEEPEMGDMLWSFPKHQKSISVEFHQTPEEDDDSDASIAPRRRRFRANSLSSSRPILRHSSRLDEGAKLRFELPEVLPKINASFMPTKHKAAPLEDSGIVGKSMSLVPQASYSSFEGHSDDPGGEDDDEDDKSLFGDEIPYRRPRAKSLPRLIVEDYGLASIVIRSMEEERELLSTRSSIASSRLETPLGNSVDSIIDMVQSANNNSDGDSLSVEVPAAELSGRMVKSPRPVRTPRTPRSPSMRRHSIQGQEKPPANLKKKTWKPNRKAKSKEEQILFDFKQSGSSSSHSGSDSTPDLAVEDKYCLRRLLHNHAIECSKETESKTVENYLDVARSDFDAMINRKRLLDESQYNSFARTAPASEKFNQLRRESTTVGCPSRCGKGEDLKPLKRHSVSVDTSGGLFKR